MKINRKRIKVIGNAHLWCWIDFIQTVGGIVRSNETKGNTIKYIVLDVITLPDDDLLKEYNFTYKLLSEVV